MKCVVCGEFFNPACLSEVFEHEHKDLRLDREYFGREISKEFEEKLNDELK